MASLFLVGYSEPLRSPLSMGEAWLGLEISCWAEVADLGLLDGIVTFEFLGGLWW